MDNSAPTQPVEKESSEKNSGPLIIFIVALVLVAIALWQFSGGKIEKRPMDANELLKQEVKAIEEPVLVENNDSVIELVPVETEAIQIEPLVEEADITEPAIILPTLDESDSWLQQKLPELTWRNELLTLLINEDMIRRFVVFTDNFSQGLLAYDHSPFTQPKTKFTVDEQSLSGDKLNVWQWDKTTSKRFDLYVDLLRSVDSTILVNWYFEVKPLVDEAYSELGYEEDFTYTLQDAITRVLDMELPKSSMALTRTSVMYKYQEPQLEKLADSDKLLLRIGKENLLIIKSVLLEINEKLAKEVNDRG
jgi:hypothetical protein